MTEDYVKSLTALAEAAFQQAARNVVERAKQTNTPLIIWKDGAVASVDPRDFVLETPENTNDVK